MSSIVIVTSHKYNGDAQQWIWTATEMENIFGKGGVLYTQQGRVNTRQIGNGTFFVMAESDQLLQVSVHKTIVSCVRPGEQWTYSISGDS